MLEQRKRVVKHKDEKRYTSTHIYIPKYTYNEGNFFILFSLCLNKMFVTIFKIKIEMRNGK